MSQSGLSFTLLESGTSRLHFRLAKALEDAVSPDQQDLIIIDTIAQIRAQLASRSSSNNVTKLTSALLTLLHCCYHYPVSSGSFPSSRTAIDVGFALVPTLQLLGLATEWKHLLLAYQLLPFLLPSKARSDHAVGGISEKPGRSEDLISSETQTLASASTSSPLSSSIVRGRSSGLRPSSPSYQGEVSRASSLASPNVDETSSLLLLNTFRSNLTAATAAAATQPRQVTRREQSSRSRSRSPSVSRPSTKATDIFSLDPSSVRVRFRALASLRSLATGTPHGPAVLPSLASTLVALTRHSDDTIRSTTLKAMLACASVNIQNQPDRDGQNEMLDAALTIVRLTLASTYAFSPGSGIGEQQGMILAEMDRRVDSNPSVLRACIKLSNHAREKGLITEQEAACHAIEALQASRWAPMHLELPALQQHRVVSTVVDLTKGIRERMAARQRTSLQADHDYYGIYAPWLVEACLSSLATSVKSMQKENASRMQMDESTEKELLKVVLRIYNTASQEKASALALCVSAAHCIGALYTRSENITQASPRSSRLHTDGELVALWSVLSTHIDSQLRSSNPNRKTSGLVLLETLLPVGWAQATAHPDPSEGDGKHHTESTSPLKISEMQMGHLMSLLTDPDSSIRTRILTLLNKVDSGLPALLRTQLQATLDAEIQHSGPPVESMAYVAQRLIEVALFAVTSSPAGQTVSGAAGAMSALQQAIDSGVKLGLFDPSERKLNFQQEAWAKSILSSVSNLSIDNRLELLQRLTENVESNGLSLICDLICDLTVRDIRQSEEAIDRFVGWVSGQRLGDDGFVGLLRKGSEQKNASHARQTVLGATARTISLVVQLVGPSQASADLVKCFTSLDPLLANIVESEQRTALRAQASNLQLICHTLQHLDPLSESTLALKIGSLAAPFQNTEDAARRLLEFHLDDLTSKEADDVRSVSSKFGVLDLLA
uniref:Thiamin pyrophosphokinase-related protein n=1 Tax=Melanopsichium pennsylvanicum 4 TaxID=1398559 RepID=A0A077R3G7_9BASI|nr:thiamin pyrophosphokinase-related protein [Melanopsichium pennsylvanicum 4]